VLLGNRGWGCGGCLSPICVKRHEAGLLPSELSTPSAGQRAVGSLRDPPRARNVLAFTAVPAPARGSASPASTQPRIPWTSCPGGGGPAAPSPSLPPVRRDSSRGARPKGRSRSGCEEGPGAGGAHQPLGQLTRCGAYRPARLFPICRLLQTGARSALNVDALGERPARHLVCQQRPMRPSNLLTGVPPRPGGPRPGMPPHRGQSRSRCCRLDNGRPTLLTTNQRQ